jgi:hypothetical protein
MRAGKGRSVWEGFQGSWAPLLFYQYQADAHLAAFVVIIDG